MCVALPGLLLALAPGVLGLAFGLAAAGVGLSLAATASLPWLDEAFPSSQRGLAYGTVNLLFAGGYAIGPVVGGVLYGASGAALPYLLVAAGYGLGALVLVLRSRRRWTSPRGAAPG